MLVPMRAAASIACMNGRISAMRGPAGGDEGADAAADAGAARAQPVGVGEHDVEDDCRRAFGLGLLSTVASVGRATTASGRTRATGRRAPWRCGGAAAPGPKVGACNALRAHRAEALERGLRHKRQRQHPKNTVQGWRSRGGT